MLCDQCHRTVTSAVVFDVDGTLGNWHSQFLAFMSLWLDEEVSYGYDGRRELSDYLGLRKEVYREAKLAFRSGGYKRWMPTFEEDKEHPLEPILEACWGLDIWIATTRPWRRLDNVDRDLEFWLDRNGIHPKGIVYGEDKYAQLARIIDPASVLVAFDDDIEQIREGIEEGFEMCFRFSKWNTGMSWGRTVVPHAASDYLGMAQVIETEKRWKNES